MSSPAAARPSTTAVVRAFRAVLRRARRVPASVGFGASVLVVSLLSHLGGLEAESEWLEARAAEPLRLWTLVFGVWTTPTWHVGLSLALAFAIIGGLFEASMGARKWLAAFAASSIGGILVVQATHAILTAVGLSWGEAHAGRTPLVAAVFGLVGVAAAGSAWMGSLGRLRLRALLFASLLVLVAFGGTPQGVGGLAGAVIGLIIGLLVGPKGRDGRSLVGTRHRGRSATTLVVLTLSAGTVLAALSTHAVGPLSTAGLDINPGDLSADSIEHLCATASDATCQQALSAVRTKGVAPALLILMPFALQAALAWGLMKGRRIAAVATIVLQAAIGLFALARVLLAPVQFSIESGTNVPAQIVLPPTPLSRLIVPVLVPAAMIALVVSNRSWFAIRSTRASVRQGAATALGATLAIGLLVLLGGLSAPHATVPEPTAGLLLANFGARLLPPSALTLLVPTLLPATWAGGLLVEWAPLAVWAVWTIAALLLFSSAPEVASAPSAKAMDPKEFVRSVGAGSLGWMLTWPGNERWLADDGSALVTYRSTSGVALTITDPAASPEDVGRTVSAFADFATAHSMIPALYSVHARTARAARDLGWTTIRVAEEAVIDLPGLAFTGKKFQDVRTALNRAEKEGIRAEWTTFPSAPEGVRDQIRAISNAWANEKALPEMGFTLGSLAEIDDESTRLLLAIDEDGTVHAVTSWLPVYEDGELIGLTLDVMRRRDNSFRPVIEFLIGSAALAARDEGLQILSLSGAPLAHSGLAPEDPELDTESAQRFAPVLDYVGGLLEPVYGFRSLLFFKKKFQPRFEPLYLALPEGLDIPAVGVAIGRAYLPDLGPIDAARFAQKLMKNE